MDEGTQSALVREERGRRRSKRNLPLSIITEYGGIINEMILAERAVALGVSPLPPPLNEAGGDGVTEWEETKKNNETETRNNPMPSYVTTTVSETLDKMSTVDFLSSMRYQYPLHISSEGTSNQRTSVHHEGYDGGDGGGIPPKPYFGGGDRRRKKGPQAEVKRHGWKYRRGILVASLRAHSLSVNRLAIASDGSYFVSCSSDGTSCVWEVEDIEHGTNLSPQPQVTYTGQHGRILDVCVIEGSQALATVSSEGSIHVWRVETTTLSKPSMPIGRKRTPDDGVPSPQRGPPMKLTGMSSNMKSNGHKNR